MRRYLLRVPAVLVTAPLSVLCSPRRGRRPNSCRKSRWSFLLTIASQIQFHNMIGFKVRKTATDEAGAKLCHWLILSGYASQDSAVKKIRFSVRDHGQPNDPHAQRRHLLRSHSIGHSVVPISRTDS